MVRNYKRKLGGRKYVYYDRSKMIDITNRIREGEMSKSDAIKM